METKDLQLPERIGPLMGARAFTDEGELQIYTAVQSNLPGIRYRIAAECNVSLVTIAAICRRVEARIALGEVAPVAPARRSPVVDW